MIKRTLYFGNPAYLKTQQEQLIIELPNSGETKTLPIEDIGLVLLDHAQITITQTVIAKLLQNNVALVTCDATHHPTGLLLNLEGNSLQSQKFQAQIEASIPLKKQLWAQTVAAKIYNQAQVLAQQQKPHQYLLSLSTKVKSGDAENAEAQAAAYYWKQVFPASLAFSRDRYGLPPNNLLNYGYAILRALVARSLVGSGLLPTLGIHHKNQYNAYCLADDIMEPYRPYVDNLVCQIIKTHTHLAPLDKELKKIFLGIPAIDAVIEGKKSPLMNAVQRTTASLAKCFEGKQRKIVYPVLT